MGKRIGRRMKRAVTILTAALLVVESVNCASMTARADEGAENEKTATSEVSDALRKELEELQNLIDAAEDADETAYGAMQDAEAAKDAAEQLAQAVSDELLKKETPVPTESPAPSEEPAVTESPAPSDEPVITGNPEDPKTTETPETTEVPALSDKIEQPLSTAEAAVEKETQDIEAAEALVSDEKEKELADKTAEELKKAQAAKDSADEAQAKADEAVKAIEEALASAESGAVVTVEEMQEQLEKLNEALDDAKQAELEAKTAYEAAEKLYNDAMSAYNDALKALENESQDVDAALAAAEKAVGDAEKVVVDAYAAYLATMNAAESTYDKILSKEELLAALANEENEAAVTAQEALDTAAENAAKAQEAAVAAKEKEIAEYKAIIAEATAAQATATEKEKKELQATIDSYNVKLAAANTELAVLVKATFDEESEVLYFDEERKKKATELDENCVNALEVYTNSYSSFEELQKDTDAYEKAANEIKKIIESGLWETLENLDVLGKDVASAGELEIKYHVDTAKVLKTLYELIQGEASPTDVWKCIAEGTHITASYSDNLTVLVQMTADKATVVKLNKTEYAAYSAAVDAEAAYNAKKLAEQAAAEEKAALEEYSTALKALQSAKDRLAELQRAAAHNRELKEKLKLASAAYRNAYQNMVDAKAAYDETVKIRENIEKQLAEETENVENAELANRTSFYVLKDASVGMPNEPQSFPKSSYTADGIYGAIDSEIAKKVTTARSTWIVRGSVSDEAFESYILKYPTAEELGLSQEDYDNIYWYVIKKEADGYHVDGIVANATYDVTLRYGQYDENGVFAPFDSTVMENSVVTHSGYKLNSIFTEGENGVQALTEFTGLDGVIYGRETALFTNLAIVRNVTIDIAFTEKPLSDVEFRYFSNTVKEVPDYGTASGKITTDRTLSEEALQAYAAGLDNNVLNMRKPIVGYYDGVVAGTPYLENGKVIINIVYLEIPAEPGGTDDGPGDDGDDTPDDTPVTPGTEPVPPVTVPVNPVNATTPTAVVTPVEPVENEPVEEIEEIATPLAPEIDDNNTPGEDAVEVVDIEEEETPLAGAHCWIHWLILILTAVYTIYEVIRSIARNKRIRELEEQHETIEA